MPARSRWRPRSARPARSRWSAGSVTGGRPSFPGTAAIARELALCYTSLAVVTDLDAGVESGEGVTHAEVLKTFAASIEKLKTVMREVISRLPDDDDCTCRRSLDGLELPFELP